MAKKNDYVKRHNVLLALISHGEKRFRWGEIIRYTPSEVDSIVAGMPAEDVRENVRGEWMGESMTSLQVLRVCGNCRNVAPVGRFCYRCGAYMTEGEKNHD